jgi:NTE family protein
MTSCSRQTALNAIVAVTLWVMFCAPAPADTARTTPPDKRPKIGLVLSGGGAKGAAHVGVLKVLEELRIPIDYVSGTSMGAVVGGLYASGMSPEQIDREIRTIDWDDTLDDDPPRVDRPYRRKRDDDNYLVKKKPGLNDGKIELPLGVIQGQKFDVVLNRLTLPVAHVHDFDDLAIPFRANASDLETGGAVVLGEGNLARAIHASMAVPGAFAPVDIDGRMLIDGGIANNLPMDVARDMGAEQLIIIDISGKMKKSEEIKSIISMLGQLTAYLTNKNVERQLATLGPNDVYLRPELGDISSADFHDAGEAIDLGETAAHEAREKLSAFTVSQAEYENYLANHRTLRKAAPIIEFVRINNDSRLGDALIAERLEVRVGETLDVEALEADIADLYGLDLFQSIRYEVVKESGKTGLVIDVIQRSWGPNYLQFGLAIADDLDGNNSIDIAASYLRTAINERNGEIRLAAQLGERPSGLIAWYQPLDIASRYFIHSRLFYDERNIGRFSNGDQLDEFRVERLGGGIAAGRVFGKTAEARIGFRRFFGDAEIRIGNPNIPQNNFDNAEAFVRLSYDSLDNRNWPEHGALASVESAHTWGRNTLLGGGEFASTLDGTAPLQNRFLVGGFTDLSGFVQDELSGSEVAIVRIGFWRSYELLKLIPGYAGFTIEYGNVFEDKDDISFDPEDSLIAGSIFVGVDTILGPIYISYGHAERGNDSVYFFLGRIF